MNSSNDNDDWAPSCGCLACLSLLPHAEGECPHPGVWWIEIHLVDRCEEVEGGATRAVICRWCFEALTKSAKDIVDRGMAGQRSPLCGGCKKPLVRLSNIITDVARL